MTQRISMLFITGLVIAFSSKKLLWDFLHIYPDYYPLFDSYLPGLIALCVMSYGLIDLQALLHADKIRKGIIVTHWRVSTIRFFVSLALVSIIHVFNYNIVKVIDLMLFSFCWFGMSFNWKLNDYRDLPVFYVHKGGFLSRKLRRLRHGGELLFALQGIGMIVSALAYLS